MGEFDFNVLPPGCSLAAQCLILVFLQKQLLRCLDIASTFWNMTICVLDFIALIFVGGLWLGQNPLLDPVLPDFFLCIFHALTTKIGNLTVVNADIDQLLKKMNGR